MKSNRGQILIQAIVFGSVAIFLLGALLGWASLNIKAGRQAFNRESALQIAEAGIDYYRWHLAHAPTDFQDGTGGPGPYVHDFRDKNDNIIGQFSLTITPPPLGSTLVTITATGTTSADPSISRTIVARLAKPSFAKYAWVLNSEFVRFGDTAEVFGPIHSNTGIRFDGRAHNAVTSALATYNDPDHLGSDEFGVHTHGNSLDPGSDPLPPSAVPNRPLIFESGRQFPVPAVDFAGITVDLASMKSNAQANGVYLANSGALGYRINLRTNDTFDVYRVNSVVPACGPATWSISGETFIQNYPNPANGIIFVEDHTWVSGQINTARLIIASGRLPDSPVTRTNIIVNNDLLYTNYDGSDVIGLVAQGNFYVGLVSEDNLRVDAAIIAQNGYISRPSYPSSSCGPTRRRTLFTSYGMLGSNLRPAFVYSSSNGYQSRVYIYDANLLYGPPPSFPLTSDQYITLTWEEK